MDRKDWFIKQAQASIARHDQNMDYQSKVLREQTLAFLNRYMSPDHLALTVAHSLRHQEEKTPHGG